MHFNLNKKHTHWTENLLKLFDEVLFNGLFHPSHVDEFLSLRGTLQYAISNDGESKK